MAITFSDILDPQISGLLVDGKIGVIPTDTLYGLVCCAANPASAAKLFALKNRERKPGTIIAASVDQLIGLGLKKRYLTAVQQYWPGAVSVVIPSSDVATNYLRQGASGLAVRIVGSKPLISLLQQTGPLITSSANLTGEKPAETINEAKDYFGDSIDFYVDMGNLSNRKPSTVIRVVDDAVEVLREGAVTIKQ